MLLVINTSIANSSSFCSGSLRSTPAAPNAEVSGQVLLSAEARVQICNATGVREKGKERRNHEEEKRGGVLPKQKVGPEQGAERHKP